MAKKEIPMHYVGTLEEAEKMIARQKKFWVSNCGCRENRGNKCLRSRTDVCLYFTDTFGSSGSGFRKSSKREAKKILIEAREKFLVARPFRDTKNKKVTDGICFCCDDCCDYFLDATLKCDKGKFIEETDRTKCTACGTCVDVCYFNARNVDRGDLKITSSRCYGCGLCASICPEECVEMVLRSKKL